MPIMHLTHAYVFTGDFQARKANELMANRSKYPTKFVDIVEQYRNPRSKTMGVHVFE
jgi:hypothetical protein